MSNLSRWQFLKALVEHKNLKAFKINDRDFDFIRSVASHLDPMIEIKSLDNWFLYGIPIKIDPSVTKPTAVCADGTEIEL